MEVQGQTIPFELFGLTGVPSLKPFGENLLEIGKTLMSIATETEATAEPFHREHSELDEGNQYFRFSVSEGLKGIGLEEAAQKSVIIAATRRYVESQTVKSIKAHDCSCLLDTGISFVTALAL